MHGKSATKRSGNGKRKHRFRDKRRSEVGNYFTASGMVGAKDEKDLVKIVRRRGGGASTVLKRAAFANLLTKNGFRRTRIRGVMESRDNRNFARQNIITKGTIINTEAGKAVVTNRPGREGSVNAKLLED